MAEPRSQRGVAGTGPDQADPRLRGRTLAIPFETVWQTASRLAGGGLSRWSIVAADDQDGEIRAFANGLFGAGHDIVIRISLDLDAQTRVDATATARKPGTDMGRAARCLRRFFRALDRGLSGSRGRATAGRRS